MIFQASLIIFRDVWSKIKAKKYQTCSIYWKVDDQLYGTIWRLFPSEKVAVSWKPFFGNWHYRILHWSKRHMHVGARSQSSPWGIIEFQEYVTVKETFCGCTPEKFS